jgi:hypothetical protein
VRDACTATTAAIRWLILGFGGRCPPGRRLAETRVPSARRGRLAQLVERLPYKQEVTGSSPVPPIAVNILQAGVFLESFEQPQPQRKHPLVVLFASTWRLRGRCGDANHPGPSSPRTLRRTSASGWFLISLFELLLEAGLRC